MKASSHPHPVKEKKPIDSSHRGFGSKTILYNDDVHTFDEVAHQLVRAIHCSFSEGLAIAKVVDSSGSAVVYGGHLERCEAVAMVLSEIGLKAVVET